mgnify:FL=1
MAEFNKENKISFDELAPSLQAMIKNAITEEEFNSVTNIITNINKNLNGIRISIVADPANISNPQNDKELAVVLGDKYVYVATYSNGWKKACAVYA